MNTLPINTDSLYAYDKYLAFVESSAVPVAYEDFIQEYEYAQWHQAWHHRQAQRPPEAAQAPLSLRVDHAQARLAQTLQEAIEEGGKWCLHVDCGTGKTHGAALSCIELWSKALFHSIELRNAPRIAFILPTNELALECEAKLRELAPLHLSARAAEAFEVELVQAPKRTAQNCARFDVISKAHRISHTAARTMCQTCDQRAQCPFLADTKTSRGHITIMTHELAFSQLKSRDYDLVLIDEGIFGAMYPTLELDLNQLAKLKEQTAVTIDDGAWSTLTDLLSRGSSVSSDELAQALPPASISYKNDTFVQELVTSASRAEHAEQLELLSQAPQLDALRMLEECAQAQWKGAYIHKHTLCLSIKRPLDFSRIRTVLYMDATTSPLHVQAILGEDHQLVRLPVELPECVEVEHIDWSWSKSLVKHGRVRYDVNYRRIQAITSRYDSDSTAWILHKDHRECAQIAHQLEQAEQAQRVMHYGAARGSNRFESFDTIVVTARHMPLSVIAARAELLEQLTGAPWAQCVDEAYDVLEMGEMIQAAHRIRPTRSTTPTTIVLVDERETMLDMMPTRYLDVDVLVMDELGDVRGSACYDTLIQRHVDCHGFLIPSKYRRRDTQGGRITEEHVPNLPPCVSQPTDDLLAHAKGLRHYAHDYWANNWSKIAKYLGFTSTTVRTSQGGHDLVIVHRIDHAMDLDALGAELRLLGVTWFEWEGERISLNVYKERLLWALDRVSSKNQASYEGLAHLLDVSTRTIRRWIDEAGFLLEELQDLWEWMQEQRAGEQEALKRHTPLNVALVMHETHGSYETGRDAINQASYWTHEPAPPG